MDLRPAKTYSRSTAALLSKVRGIIFFDIKVNLMNRVLNATTKRKPDQAAPEISLDPLETIGGEISSFGKDSFCSCNYNIILNCNELTWYNISYLFLSKSSLNIIVHSNIHKKENMYSIVELNDLVLGRNKIIIRMTRIFNIYWNSIILFWVNNSALCSEGLVWL